MFLKILDYIRILSVSIAFFFGYQIAFAGSSYNAIGQLHFMIPIIIFAIAGLSGLEGLFFSDQSARLKGFAVGSNYQKQSAYAFLSYAVVSLLILILNWGIKAELSILFVFMFFFILSAINHGREAIIHKNYSWQNINRPFITLFLIIGLIYPIIIACQSLNS